MESAERLHEQALKKLQPKKFFSFFMGGPDYDEIGDLLCQAACQYKLEKNWEMAAKTYLHASEIYDKAGDKVRNISCLTDAAHVFKKYSIADAIKAYNNAADALNKSGRFGQSAKTYKTIAELYENQGDMKNAEKFYSKAAQHFDLDEYGKTQYSACILKYAELTSLNANTQEAIQIFEAEAEKAAKNTLIQTKAREYLLQAGLLHLSTQDIVDVQIILERYEDICPRFNLSREGKLLTSLVKAVGEQNHESYEIAVAEYEKITKLDNWKLKFICDCRDKIEDVDFTESHPAASHSGKTELLLGSSLL